MTQQVANDAANSGAGDVFERVDSRAAALEAKFASETRAASVEGDVDEQAGNAPAAEPAARAAGSEPATPAPDDRFEKLLKLESESLRKSQEAKKQARDAEAKLKAAEERAKKAEELEKMWTGADGDPDRILEMLEKHVGPERLVKWFEEQSDPVKRAARVAEQQGKKELDPVMKRLAELEAKEKQRELEGARSTAEREFTARVEAVAADAPLSSRLLKRAPAKLISRADAVVDDCIRRGLRFGEDYNFDDVISEVEKQLKDDHDALVAEAAEQAAGDNKTATTKTPANTAAEQAKTVSNRAASERTTLSNEAPKMSYEERQAAVTRKLRRMA